MSLSAGHLFRAFALGGDDASLSHTLGTLGSLALHVLIAASLLWPSKPRLPMLAPSQPEFVELLPGITNRAGTLGDSRDESADCLGGKPYLGVGLQLSLEHIVVVAPGIYPAYQAGVRLGDLVLNPEFEPRSDGYANVDIARGHKHHRFRIKAQWICLR